MRYGKTAQVHAVARATVIPKIRSPIRYSVKQVRAAKTLLKARITHAESALYTPNNLNTPARIYGYKGGAHALGPVGRSVGELNPWPVAMERARRPISQPY